MNLENNTYLMAAFFAFLFLNLVVGWAKGRNVTTLKDYALANRGLGTGTLMITIIATILGAKYVTGKITDSYEFGIITPFIQSLAYIITALWLGRYVFPKLLRFQDCYTLGDIMGKIYGRKAQITTGIFSVITSVLFIAAQLVTVGSLAKQNILQFEQDKVIIIVGIAIMLYTVLGGMRSVSATDMVQFLFVLGGFLLLSYKALKIGETKSKDFSGLKGLFDAVGTKSPEKMSLWGHISQVLQCLAPITFAFTFFSPAIINRVLMGRNEAQVKQSFTGFAVFYPVLRFLLTIIGFGLLFVTEDATQTNVFGQIQNKLYAQNEKWVTILLMLMLLAVVMSTADSILNALVVVIWRDVIAPLRKEKQKKNVLPWLRGLAVAMGFISILLALYFQKVSPVILVTFSQLSLGIFAFPLIWGALGLKGNAKAFFYSIAAFSIVCIILITLLALDYNIFFICDELWNDDKFNLARKSFYVTPWALLVSGLAFFGFHYNANKKLVWQPLKKRVRKTRAFRTEEKPIWTVFTEPIVWAKDRLVRYGAAPELVGIFLTLWHMVPLVTGINQIMTYYTGAFILLHIIALSFYLGLLLEKVWRHPVKKLFPLFYFVALMYCLPFYHLLFFLYEPGAGMSMIQLFFAMMLLHILVDWRTYTLLTTIGMSMAVLVYWLTMDQNAKGIDFAVGWDLTLGFLAVSLLGFFFLSRQERVYENRVERTRLIGAGFGHDLLNIFSYMKSVEFERDKQNPKEDDWENMIKYLNEAIRQARAFKRLVKYDGILEKDIVPCQVATLVENAYLVIGPQYKDKVKIVKSKDFTVPACASFINNIIGNLVKNAIIHGGAENIILSWDANANEIYITDDGIGISDEVAPYIFDLYYSADDSGVGLSFTKSIMANIDGDLTFKKNKGNSGVTFVMTFARPS